MGIREKLNQNPAAATIGVALVIIAALVVIIYSNRGVTLTKTDKSWYTADDGKTLFQDENMKVAPFKKDGAEAVKAYVYRCKGKQYVAYLQRFTEEAQKMTAEIRKTRPDFRPIPQMVGEQNVEIKKPGDKTWVKLSDRQNTKRVWEVDCPGGTKADIEMID